MFINSREARAMSTTEKTFVQKFVVGVELLGGIFAPSGVDLDMRAGLFYRYYARAIVHFQR